MIIYLHGFSSAANSRKAQWLKKNINETQVLVPDYPSHQPANAIKQLTQFIKQLSAQESQRVMLIGSSLGGYYAQYFGSTLDVVEKVVMINPALQPQQTLTAVIGKQTNMVTGEPFEFTGDNLDELASCEMPTTKICVPTLVLLDEGDDIIDFSYAKQKYTAIDKAKVLVYPGGSHWFEHLENALPEIMNFYRSSENSSIP